MKYHQIKKDDLLNGDGIRVTVFLSGCNHYCHGCHNPQTWSPDSGQFFDWEAKAELFAELEKDYISGVTFSGGDPLHENNITSLTFLCEEIKEKFPDKNIWIYTGYKFEDICNDYIENSKCRNIYEYDKDFEVSYRLFSILHADVLVDGKFEEDKADVNYHWAGSTNQRVIDVKKTFLPFDKQKELICTIKELMKNSDKNIILYEG